MLGWEIFIEEKAPVAILSLEKRGLGPQLTTLSTAARQELWTNCFMRIDFSESER